MILLPNTSNLFKISSLSVIAAFCFLVSPVNGQVNPAVSADTDEQHHHPQQMPQGKSDGLEYHNQNFSQMVAPRTYPAGLGIKYNEGNQSHPDFGKLAYNAPMKNVVEVISKRKMDEKYYVDIDDPSFFYIQKSGIPLHYEKNGQLLTIDPILSEKNKGVFAAVNQPYPTKVDFNTKNTSINCGNYNVENNNYSLSVIDKNNNMVTYQANWSDYVVGNNGAYVNNVFPGIDMKLIFGEGQLKSNFIIKGQIPNAKRLIFTDHLNLSSGLTLSQQSGSYGSLFVDDININDPNFRTQYTIKKAFSQDASGDRTHFVFNKYKVMGNDIELHIDSTVLEMSNIVYPLTIDPLIIAVGPIAAPANTIGSQLTPAFCTQVLTVSFPGGSMPWDFSTSWQTQQTSCCSSIFACLNSDPRVEILSNCGGRTPSGAGLYWSCSPGCNTSGTWTPTLPFNSSGCQSMTQCLPASCSPQNITFSLNLLRVFCANTSGCNCTWATNTCSRLLQWNVTLQGRTVEWTNVATPFSLSSNTVCAGGNITATSNGTGYGVPPLNITWSFNSSGIPTVGAGSPASINFPAAGNYTVYGVVTDACGGQQIVSQTATAIAIPTANAGLPKSLTCVQTTTVLNGSGGGTYSWSGPGTITTPTSQNPTINTPGVFSLIVNVAGCNSPAANVTVTQNTTAPVTTAGTSGSVTCTNNTINLTSSTGGLTYTWTAPGGSSITGGVNNQNTTGSGPGTYTIRVTDAVNGCTNIATVAALINTTVPAPTAGTSASVTCTNSVINLTSNPAGLTYTWTAPGGSSITGGVNNQNTTGSGPGTYTVKVQNAVNGCTNIATVSALVNTTVPAPTAGTSASVTCTNSVINLTSNPAGLTYTWTAPGGSSITGGVNNQNTTGSGPGTYTVKVQDAVNGCTAQAVVAANVNTTAPTPTAGTTGLVTCSSTTVSLTSGPGAMNYTWTAPAGSSITGGVNNQNTTGSGPGSYSVLVQNPTNGCSTQTIVTASTNTTPPSPSINPTPTITCGNPTVTLNGNPGAGVTYTWTGPGIVGSANNQTVNVNQVGNYTLTVTSSVNGCTNTVSSSVGNNTIAPTITPVANQTITCSTPTVQLIGSANPSTCTVLWSGAGICGGATTYTASVCAAGTFSYVATNPANGCQSAPQTTTVVPNSGVPFVTASNNGTITCVNTSVQVVASTTTSPATYVWSGPGIVSGAGTPTITVNVGGTYSVVVTGTNGCSSGTVTNIVVNDNAAVTPTTTSSTTITCTNPTSTLTTSAGAGTFTYNWSGPGIVGTNTLSTITSSLGGTYNVTVTNTSNGCVGTGTVSVASNTTVPGSVTVTPSSYTLSCATPTTQIIVGSTGSGVTYSWTAPGTGNILSGATTATATISGPGIYSVVATATNGCSAAVTTATMVADVNSPNVTLSSPNLSITCVSTAPGLTLTPTGTVAIASYSWSPASGISSGSNTTTPTFTASGTYTCLITATNGCTITATVPVTDNTVVPTASTPSITNISCATTSVDIIPVYSPSSGLTYTWTGVGIISSTSNSSVTVNQSGTYTVSFVDPANGCANTATYSVTGNTVVPTATVTSSSTIGIGCLPTNTAVTLDATTTPSTGVTYNWSTSATTQSISVTAPGVYSVVVTDASNGCSVTAQYTVINNSNLPNVSVVPTAAIPCGGVTTTVEISGSSTDPGVTYTWTGTGIVSGAATATAVVNMAGSYTLTVTNPTTGCSTSSVVNVTNSVPTSSITPDVTTGFAPLTVNFTNTSTNANSFTWIFGNGSSTTLTTTASTSAIYTTGTYTVMMIASSGVCSDTAYAVIVVDAGFNIEVPNVFTPNGDNVNDVFTITSTGVKEITLKIFNRWGQLMYDFVGPKASWDGITNAGGQATDGTYFYFIKATGYDGKEYEKNGSLGLFK